MNGSFPIRTLAMVWRVAEYVGDSVSALPLRLLQVLLIHDPSSTRRRSRSGDRRFPIGACDAHPHPDPIDRGGLPCSSVPVGVSEGHTLVADTVDVGRAVPSAQ